MRIFVFLSFAGVVALGCKNEPYDKVNLAVTTLTNHDSATSLNYKYQHTRLLSFQRLSGASVTTSMKFNYNGSQLVSIMSDSVTSNGVTSYKITKFYRYGTSKVIDSTKLYSNITTRPTLFAVRTVTYNENGDPLAVNQKLYSTTGMTEQIAGLTWDGGDIVRLVTTNVNTGAVRDLYISHDKKNGVFKYPADYIYTFSLQKLFWLSQHNPIIFNDGGDDKKYLFQYNRFDYPSTFRSDLNTRFGVAYENR